MKVILIKDVKNQGKKDDIINVSDGYANNYLIKNNLAVAYSETSKKILDKEIKIRQDEEDELVCSLNQIKDSLKDQISDRLNEIGYKIDKKNIIIDNLISSLGNHKVLIKLHKKVEFYITIKLTK